MDDGAGSTAAPQVEMDDQANAIAVWKQKKGSTWDIYANVYR